MHAHPDIPDAATWARLSPLLDEALDLPPSERAAWLAALQARAPADAFMLQRLLERHEAADRDAFLAGSAQPAAAHPAAGQHLGPWTIEAPLGEGGMASVWLARRSDGRHDGQAAIKLMHGRLHGTQATQRFEREGRILARLEHPHIARLLDAGVASDGEGGQPYLVLELVRGDPIDRWCDERQLDIEARLRLFVDVVQAVAAAHAQLVVHRDLKPGNVMVDAQGQVKLLDFGIARLLDEGQNEDERGAAPAVTRTGQRAYTPAWAAPEQVRGEPVSTTTDVWALGVLLCQLLTGRHPSGLPWTSELTAWMQAAARPDMKRPSQLASVGAEAAMLAATRGLPPLRLAKRLQGELDQIVLRALAEEPSRRYASVQALADDVLRHLRNETVSAVADTVGYRATKFVRRNRLAVGAASTTLLALLAGVLGTTWQALEARTQRDVAQVARAEAVAQAQRALDESDLTNAMARLVAVALGPVSDKPMLVSEVLTRAQAIADRQFAGQPRVRAYLLRQLGVMWAEGGDWGRTDTLLQAARAAAQAAGDVAQVAQADCILAIVSAYRGDFVQAQARIEAGLAVAQASPTQRRVTLIECLTNRSSIADAQGRYPAALADLDAALQALGTPRVGEEDTLFDLRIKRASVLGSSGDTFSAVTAYDQVWRALEQRGELDITAYNPALNNFANTLLAAGQVRRAEEVLRQLLVRQQGPGAGRPREPAEAINHARALTQLGRTAQAVALMDTTLAQPAVQANPNVKVRVQMTAAEAHCAAADAARCAVLASQLESALSSTQDGSQDLRFRMLLLKGRLALLQGRVAEARTQAAAALALTDSPALVGNRGLGVLVLAAQVALAEGRPGIASGYADSAVAEAREKFSGFAGSRQIGLALRMQGQVSLAAGDTGAARLQWQAAAEQLDAALGPDAADARDVRQRLANLDVPQPAR